MDKPTRIFDLAYRQKSLYPDLAMFGTKINGTWELISSETFIIQTREISKGLIELGVQPGDKVGLVSESRYEWHIIDFAIQQIGGITVAVYPNITDADYQFIFNETEIKICIVSDKSLYNRLSNLVDSIYTLKYIFAINNFEGSRHWK